MADLYYYTGLQMLNLFDLYSVSPVFWDGLVYLLIFLGLAQFVFARSNGPYGKKNGKIVALGVGLMLTLAMIVFEVMTGWRIGSLEMALLPLTILFAVIMFFLYELFNNLFGMSEQKRCAAALAFLITYVSLRGMFEVPLQNAISRLPLVSVFIFAMIIISIVVLIMCIVQLFGNGNRDTDPDPSPNPTPTPPTPGPTPPIPGQDDPLTVSIERPITNDTIDTSQPVVVQGSVAGGSGRYRWHVRVQYSEDTGKWHGVGHGSNQTVAAQWHSHYPTGTAVIQVVAEDGKSSAHAHVKVNLSGQDRKGGVIKGTAVDHEGNPMPPGNDTHILLLHAIQDPERIDISDHIASTKLRSVGGNSVYEFTDVPQDTPVSILGIKQLPNDQGITGVPIGRHQHNQFRITADNRLIEDVAVQFQTMQVEGSVLVYADADDPLQERLDPSKIIFFLLDGSNEQYDFRQAQAQQQARPGTIAGQQRAIAQFSAQPSGTKTYRVGGLLVDDSGATLAVGRLDPDRPFGVPQDNPHVGPLKVKFFPQQRRDDLKVKITKPRKSDMPLPANKQINAQALLEHHSNNAACEWFLSDDALAASGSNGTQTTIPPLQPGKYLMRVIVRDGERQAQDELEITVREGGGGEHQYEISLTAAPAGDKYEISNDKKSVTIKDMSLKGQSDFEFAVQRLKGKSRAKIKFMVLAQIENPSGGNKRPLSPEEYKQHHIIMQTQKKAEDEQNIEISREDKFQRYISNPIASVSSYKRAFTVSITSRSPQTSVFSDLDPDGDRGYALRGARLNILVTVWFADHEDVVDQVSYTVINPA